jgi:hypothetical protein
LPDGASQFSVFRNFSSALARLCVAPELVEEPSEALFMPKSWLLLGVSWNGSLLAMPRTIWLALIFLLFLSAMFALRASIGARTLIGSADAVPPPAIGAGPPPPLEKSDKLPSLDPNRAEAKASVTTVKIAPAPREAKASAKTNEVTHAAGERKEITSWHWHAGSKIVKRSTSAGQARSERER